MRALLRRLGRPVLSHSRRVSLSLFTICALTTALVMIAATRPSWAGFVDGGAMQFKAESSRFGIGLLSADRTVVATKPGAAVFEYEAGRVVPGDVVQLTIPVFNNSPLLSAQVGTAVSASGSLAGYARISAATEIDGRKISVFGDTEHPERGVPVDDAKSPSAGRMEDRQRSAPLVDGDSWSGPESSRATLRFSVYVADDATLATQQSGSMKLTITITGSSSS